MVGPIFFALIQTGVEEGIKAGTAVGAGIWVSDFLFVVVVYWGVAYVTRLTDGGHFSTVLGIGGSALLVLFGLGALLKSPSFEHYALPYTRRTSSYFSLWLKGFLINTVNPFTIFFWMGLMSTVIIKDGLNGRDAFNYFTGILCTIVGTDLLKVVLAKRIRRLLRPVHLLWLRRISGSALIIFGVALLIRALMR